MVIIDKIKIRRLFISDIYLAKSLQTKASSLLSKNISLFCQVHSNFLISGIKTCHFLKSKPVSTSYLALLNSSVAMATVNVPWHQFVLRMKAYKYIIKVTKFQLPTACRFSTAEGRPSQWVDSAPPVFTPPPPRKI